jgi:hypothetical protein
MSDFHKIRITNLPFFFERHIVLMYINLACIHNVVFRLNYQKNYICVKYTRISYNFLQNIIFFKFF